jgi:hypothetical protein
MISTIWRRSGQSRKFRLVVGAVSLGAVAILVFLVHQHFAEKRFSVVVPQRIFRGAWQRPETMRRIIRREGIRTLLTLTAINRDDPKYVEQERVVQDEGTGWLIVPMRGSTATPEQLAIAADLATDSSRQPIYFHCVAGHHRSNLVQAAIRIRHENWSASEAWAELVGLPWTRPGAEPDEEDRALIERFSRIQRSIPRTQPSRVRELTHAISAQTGGQVVHSRAGGSGHSSDTLDRLD